MRQRRKVLARMMVGVAIVGSALGASMPASAQSDRPTIRILVGFPPGGSADSVARMLADKMRVSLGQTVLVENKAGAGGRIMLNELKRLPPDGNTIALVPSGPFVVFPHIFKKLDYDPVNDFTPVARAAVFDFAITVGPGGPAGGIKDLLNWAKANPNAANFGTPGAGTLPHFVGVMFGRTSGVTFNHIAYKGGAPAIGDLVGGQVPVVIDTPLESIEMHRAGKVRIVATTGDQRSPMLPNVPTLKESGIDMTADGFFAVYGPPKLPPEVLQRLNRAVVAAVNDADTREKMTRLAITPSPSSPDELAATQATHLKRWEGPIKETGFTAD